jgi:hypothetical protein
VKHLRGILGSIIKTKSLGNVQIGGITSHRASNEFAVFTPDFEREESLKFVRISKKAEFGKLAFGVLPFRD